MTSRPFTRTQAPDTASQFQLGCPVGTWKARLDFRVWGKSHNLLLYFTRLDNDEPWCLSVWDKDGYHPRTQGLAFHTDVQDGNSFELETEHTTTGRPNFISARRL